MIQKIGNSDSRVVKAITHAIDLDKNGNTELAAEYLSAFAGDFPEVSSVHGYLALYLYRLGRFNEATEHGRRATSLAPRSEKASMILFQALWKSGDRLKALDEMKRFLAIAKSEEYSKMIEEWRLSEDRETDET